MSRDLSGPPPVHPPTDRSWHAEDVRTVLEEFDTDPARGLSASDADARLATHGANVLDTPSSPPWWRIAVRQLIDPMNVMLVIVTMASIVIDQVAVGILVGMLVAVNVVLGTRQEVKAQSAVAALADLQVPHARVIRDGSVREIPSSGVVPGDIVALEAGDVVPADGRLLTSATLETQESALTGESAPILKDAASQQASDTPLAERGNMAYQNTLVTRGTGRMVVTATGMSTQMGHIAQLVADIEPASSPLQRELAALTRVLAIIAWAAVAVIVVIGLARGQSAGTLLLLGISMAVSAIPTGLPTFVQSMLAVGAKKLAEHKAVVKNLTDVETLGATSAINSDKTGTLTMNEMTVTSLYAQGEWFTVSGTGYEKEGELRRAAGADVPDFTSLAYGLCLCSDATVSDEGVVVGDPTEAALVVLAAKLGADAELTRARYPRDAEVPFDSEYKFMATFHTMQVQHESRTIALVKGGPDVVLARCARAAASDGEIVELDVLSDRIHEANRRLSEQGLRVLAFAYRSIDQPLTGDPMAYVDELIFSGLVGIVDPLRPSSAAAVRTAQAAGIEVRMITGDHAITAAAIGAQLSLGPGAASGSDIQAMTDEQLTEALRGIHVFGRVTPQDKLRIVRLMQQTGSVVAMTGDAVNDAAALRQADVGVAMGSGSEVTKQAGNIILTDDHFGTLVTAIELGRSIYEKIVGYIRFQMSLLLSLVLLFLTASVFDINGGVAMTPIMVLFLNFFVTIFPVVVIVLDPVSDDIMSKPPRDPKQPIARPRTILQWTVYATAMFLTTLVPLLLWSAEPRVSVTMAFTVSALGSLLGGLAIRRDPEPGIAPPILNALRWLSIPAALTIASVETGFLQRWLGTTSLTGSQWLVCVGLALLVPLVVELEKWNRRRAN
ncbi:cation-translocating P-type ATPase [Microbacterium sp.]|uniref:cation-translocating P-type ATPase n=1 Tax=Microbacterium sp. TaxID=51671 RepID=UPI003C7103CA